MIKDFEGWHTLKTQLNNRNDPPEFQKRDIWWCSVGVNIGFEADGKNEMYNRPVLVLRKFNKNLFLGLPLTSRVKENPYYVKISIHGKTQCAMISQLRLFESKRLTRRLVRLDDGDFNKLQKAVISMIAD